MRAILDIILIALNLYTWVVILGAILSWLIAFGVVNMRNDFVRSAWNLFLALTEPFLNGAPKIFSGTSFQPLKATLNVL